MATYNVFRKGFLKGQDKLYITSDFGKRDLKDGRGVQNHYGIDIGVPSGTPILAPLSGEIHTRTIQKKGAGLYITLKCQVDYGTYIYILFMHLSSVPDHIQRGYDVTEGEIIGYTGGTPGDPNAGHSTGAHLHLEIRRGGNSSGNAVDPKHNFLFRENLYLKSTGELIWMSLDTPAWSTFDDSYLRTINSSPTYNPSKDTTVLSETEYKPKEEKKVEMSVTERLAPGIWQIIKLVIDSSVQDKQVADSSICSQQGSLLNFFRRVCQDPLVEFMGDTFGDQYYWIVRRPPFDKEGFTKMIELTCIDLSENDIISTDLSWNNEGIYSWYQYVPQSDILGINEANLFLPAVFFPEYAAVWGSKPLCVESNYFSWTYSGRFNKDKDENKRNGDQIIRNAISDFKFMVESNAYNPFTRRGSITINGDRRIKRGTVIQHTSGELFYVDSVTNSYEVNHVGTNRMTILNVSRGMYPKYIYGEDIDDLGKKMSYFNLIDWGEGFDINKVTGDNWQDVVSKWKVDYDSFGFFMSRQQVFRENINK